MEIRYTDPSGDIGRIKLPRLLESDRQALKSSLSQFGGSGTDRGPTAVDGPVLWQRPRLGTGVRNTARLMLGVGCVAGPGLLLAMAFTSGSAQQVTLLVLAGLVVTIGSFVTAVWRKDVGLVLYADGRMIRSGWNGTESFDLSGGQNLEVV